MKNLLSWSLVLLVSLLPHLAGAANKTLFEGYYKIISSGEHVGYYIQRYELDSKKKQFISTYFLKTNQKGGNISESLKAVATEKLNPVKYQYTSLQGKKAKTIDANVRENKRDKSILQVKVTENGKLRVFEKKLDDGVFLSTFLIYLLLQGEKGIQKGAKYQYRAIAEEDAKVYSGDVFVDSEVKKLGLDTFKVLNTFKRTQFVNFIDSSGESIVSVSPALAIEAQMVATPEEATKGMNFNKKSIELLFGNLPSGQANALYKKTQSKTPATSIAPTKSTEKKEQ